jgi:hypothetical protein
MFEFTLEHLALLVRAAWPWALRAALLALVASWIVPAGVRVADVSPQTVATVKPHVCVHTRLIDEVQPWVIQKSLASVREMGAPVIVEFFPWAYVERSPGAFDWAQSDLILKHAQQQGLRVIARLGLVPEWARPDPREQPTTFNYLPPDAYDAFAGYAAAFAERYAGVVSDLIVWNEPNLAFEWGYAHADPAEYVRLLQAVYPRVKAVNPAMRVLAGALAPTLEPEGSPNGLSDILFLEQMYAHGAADYFDALAVHTYGFTSPEDEAPAPDRLNFRRVELLRAVMLAAGDAQTPVVITEAGWNDHPRWALAVRPSQRIAYTLDALQRAEGSWPWVESLCLWALRYPRPTYSYPDHFTLITPEFQYKPIYYAVQAYARGWQSGDALWLPAPVAAGDDGGGE